MVSAGFKALEKVEDMCKEYKLDESSEDYNTIKIETCDRSYNPEPKVTSNNYFKRQKIKPRESTYRGFRCTRGK